MSLLLKFWIFPTTIHEKNRRVFRDTATQCIKVIAFFALIKAADIYSISLCYPTSTPRRFFSTKVYETFWLFYFFVTFWLFFWLFRDFLTFFVTFFKSCTGFFWVICPSLFLLNWRVTKRGSTKNERHKSDVKFGANRANISVYISASMLVELVTQKPL